MAMEPALVAVGAGGVAGALAISVAGAARGACSDSAGPCVEQAGASGAGSYKRRGQTGPAPRRAGASASARPPPAALLVFRESNHGLGVIASGVKQPRRARLEMAAAVNA